MKKAKGTKVTSKAVTKGLAIGFLSYGLLIGFIYCIFIAILYSYYQAASITQANPLLFSFFIATLIGVGIVILNYGVCKLSSIDVLKKAKLSNHLIKKSSSSMGTFFLSLMVIVVLFLNYSLLMTIITEKNALMYTKLELSTSDFSDTTAQAIFEKEVASYELDKKATIIRTLVIEFAFIVSYITLMPYQEKMLLKYNGTFEDVPDASTDIV
jgi:hypothetical protein